MNDVESSPSRRRAAHILTVLTACCIFPLIFVGAGVTTTDSGMIFPDWPTSDGAILHPSGWLGDAAKLWEHGHRLLGWTVGILAILSVISSWHTRGSARTITIVTLLSIIVQGLLGGLRVTEVSRALALVHGIWGQVCFGVAAVAAWACWPSWAAVGPPMEARGARVYQTGCIVAVAALFLQLCLGAWYRHFGSGGALVAHVLWAVVVFCLLSWLAMWTLEQYSRLQPLSFFGKALAALIAAQMVLGGLAFLVKVMGSNWPSVLATLAPTAHVAAGALMLACLVLLTLSAYRRLRAAPLPERPSPVPKVVHS